ncbi:MULTISPECIES: hypothetical protein [Natrialbaceae]|uniref:hypothetical protein n=1 Tax=Natrialbaceae TaxID=1644061 RepID=UPI00207C4B2E|nr:hypothetical protein [Natronococcus sp. CG52]
MGQTSETVRARNALKSEVEAIESKADKYEEATNFEEKKTEYLNDLSKITTELGRLERRVEHMEFNTAILSTVFDEKDRSSLSDVNDARRRVRSVVDHDQDYCYELVAEGKTDQYISKVRPIGGQVEQATEAVKDDLRDIEDQWNTRVQSAKNVQRLVSGSRNAQRTLDYIETFVNKRIWDDDEEISVLESDWRGLEKQWEDGLVVDWNQFQKTHGLSDDTIEVLKRLADGKTVKLRALSEDIAGELLSVDELQSVVELSI